MSHIAERLPMALTSYGLPHVMGYLPTKDGISHPSPMSTEAFLDSAVDLGLAGVDMPIPASIPAEELREALDSRGLRIVSECMAVVEMDPVEFRDYLARSAAAGAKVVR